MMIISLRSSFSNGRIDSNSVMGLIAPFSSMKTLSIHTYSFSNEYDLNTVSVHTTTTKTLLVA